MSTRRVAAIPVMLTILSAATIALQGCASVIPITIEPVSLSEPNDTINIDVVFVHSNRLEDFSYEYRAPTSIKADDLHLDKLLYKENAKNERTYRYDSYPESAKTAKIGNIFIRSAEIVLNNIFADVTTVHVKENYPSVGIIRLESLQIKPFWDCKEPKKRSCNYATEIVAEWAFDDLGGNRIWSSRIVGYGLQEDPSMFTGFKEMISQPLQLAIEDHFRNLTDALATAPEIKLAETCLEIDCNALSNSPSLLNEALNRVDNTDKRTKTAHRLIYMAIEQGNVSLLNELLSANYSDINQAEEYYQILPIHLAAQNNNVEAVALLIANKADIDKADNSGWTPLHYAAANGHTEVADLLLQKGADIDAKNSDAQTPFMLAITNAHTQVWQLLLDNDATYYAINENDLLGTAISCKRIGCYFARCNDKIKSNNAFELASKYFAEASHYYDDVSEKAERKALVKDILFYSAVAFAIASPTVHTVGFLPPPNPTTKSLKTIDAQFSALSEKCISASNELKDILKCYEEEGPGFKECISALPLDEP